MTIEIQPTDTLFRDSPDYGPNCLCSRCDKPIYNVPIRCWTEQGDAEYRFHPACLGFSSFDEEDEAELYDWDDEDEADLYDNCPNCGRKYDDIDYEYQICRRCNHQAGK